MGCFKTFFDHVYQVDLVVLKVQDLEMGVLKKKTTETSQHQQKHDNKIMSKQKKNNMSIQIKSPGKRKWFSPCDHTAQESPT